MCVSMFAYHLSKFIEKKEFNKYLSLLLKTIEIFGYNVPVVLRFVPISENFMPIIM